MTRTEKILILVALAGLVVLTVVVFRLSEARHLAEQLRGQLTEAEQRFQAVDDALGTARAQLVTASVVAAQDAILVASGAIPSAEAFDKANHAHVEAVTTAKAQRTQRNVPGVSTFGLTAAGSSFQPTKEAHIPKIEHQNTENNSTAPSFDASLCQFCEESKQPGPHLHPCDKPGDNTSARCVLCEDGSPGSHYPAPRLIDSSLCQFCEGYSSSSKVKATNIEQSNIAYDWHDTAGRFHLHDPDVLHPGSATFSADQHYRLTVVALRQDTGALRTDQVALQELDSAGAVIGPATISDAQFSYAPDPPAPLFDPHLTAGVVLTVPPRLPVEPRLGASVGALLVQYRGFGIRAAGYTDARSLEGSGGAVGAFYRPSWAGRSLNVAVQASVAVGLTGVVSPQAGVDFVVW